MLVYFLMAVNFQSWLDPFIILMALPGALAGIVWMLFITQTTFSVPSLMGSIMCIGVATANSILMVVFANDQRLEGMDPRAAALSAGHTRIRPVHHDGGGDDHRHGADGAWPGRRRRTERAAGPRRDRRPHMATFTTLFAVPVAYSLLRKKVPVDFDKRIEEEEHEDPTLYLLKNNRARNNQATLRDAI